MNNQRITLLLTLSFALLLTSCATANTTSIATDPTGQAVMQTPSPYILRTETTVPDSSTNESAQATNTTTPAAEKTKPVHPSEPAETSPVTQEESSMTTILISVGNASFPAKLYENETTRALLAQFPLRVNMSELDGKEKYYNLPENLPSTVTEKPATIRAGEIMLWSPNVLVLFYNTFPNSYGGYVKLGYVVDATGLADALGSGDVQVTFTVSE